MRKNYFSSQKFTNSKVMFYCFKSDKATINQLKEKLNENELILKRLRKNESDILNERNSQKKKNDIF